MTQRIGFERISTAERPVTSSQDQILRAAPLGTDDEAGAAGPSEARVATARADEATRPPTDIGPDTGGAGGAGHAWILIIFTLLLGLGLVAFMIWHRGA